MEAAKLFINNGKLQFSFLSEELAFSIMGSISLVPWLMITQARPNQPSAFSFQHS